MSIAFPPMSYFFLFLEIFYLIPAALTAQSELHVDFHEFEEKLHDQARNFLQAKNKLVTTRIWSPHSIWLQCGGCIYIGRQKEILGYNSYCQ